MYNYIYMLSPRYRELDTLVSPCVRRMSGNICIATFVYIDIFYIHKRFYKIYLLFVIISTKSWNLSTNNFVLHR